MKLNRCVTSRTFAGSGWSGLKNPSPGADASRVIVPVLIAVGFILGLLVGRWWALTAALGFGVWVAIVSEVEVPGWFLGLWYGTIGCVGIGSGIAVSRVIHRLRHTA